LKPLPEKVFFGEQEASRRNTLKYVTSAVSSPNLTPYQNTNEQIRIRPTPSRLADREIHSGQSNTKNKQTKVIRAQQIK